MTKTARGSVLTAATTLLIGLLVALGAAPAQAQHEGRLKVCTSDGFKGYCLTRWDYDSNFGNDYFVCKTWCLNQNFNDAISSVDNDTDNWWKLYEDKNYGGYVLCLRPRGYDRDLGNNTPLEDDISSVKEFGTKRPSGCDKAIG